MSDISERIVTARKAAGMSAYRLAKVLGVPQSVVWRWEGAGGRGGVMPRADTLERIMAAIGAYADGWPHDIESDGNPSPG